VAVIVVVVAVGGGGLVVFVAVLIIITIVEASHNGLTIAIRASQMSFHCGKWGGFVTLLSLLSQWVRRNSKDVNS
jgi:hypothetical protein